MYSCILLFSFYLGSWASDLKFVVSPIIHQSLGSPWCCVIFLNSKLLCFADVCWFHTGNVLKESPSCLLSQTGNNHHITMFNMSREQAGQYSLAVVNSQGEVWHSFNVGVIGIFWKTLGSSDPILVPIEITSVPQKPPVIVRSPTSSYAEEGQALVAACKVEGFPEPRVDFFKEGNLIKNNDTFTVGK